MMILTQAAASAQAGPLSTISAGELTSMMREFRGRTYDLVADLDPGQLIGPRLPTVNPPLWEIGHVGWFQEFWILRHLRRRPPLLENGDQLYNSTDIAHDVRWELLLPSLDDTRRYMKEVLDRAIEPIEGKQELTGDELYFYLLATFHEGMHAEALAYTRQALGYSKPRFIGNPPQLKTQPEWRAGDAQIPGGMFVIGATPEAAFVFDNEKWAHERLLRPFRITRAAVTNGQFREFVEDGGYRQPRFWSEEGRRWLETGGAPQLEHSFAKFFNRDSKQRADTHAVQNRLDHPIYWRRNDDGKWQQRIFDHYVPLDEDLPVVHVCWYEAEAYCNWAGRRLPTEAEWEAAASGEPAGDHGGLGTHRRHFPWGDVMPGADDANLDWGCGGVVPVSAYGSGDSAFGCRQMIGNVWEWTADDFAPYPGFSVDPYKEYSKPWFGTHKVLRGGCWATSSRLIRNTWRNFYTPDRRDVWAGFRTCAN